MRIRLKQLSKRSYGWPICMLACCVAVIQFSIGGLQVWAAEETPAEPAYKVVSPIGESIVRMTTMAPRLDTLSGSTVCMVWNRAFKADVTFRVIEETLKKRFPTVKIVPHDEMPVASLPGPPGNHSEESKALQAAFKRNSCNAVVSGNGG